MDWKEVRDLMEDRLVDFLDSDQTVEDWNRILDPLLRGDHSVPLIFDFGSIPEIPTGIYPDVGTKLTFVARADGWGSTFHEDREYTKASLVLDTVCRIGRSRFGPEFWSMLPEV